MSVDVESELVRLGTRWSDSVAHVDVAEVLERTMAARSQPVDDTFDPPVTSSDRMRADPRSRRSRQRWLVAAACTALVGAGVVALAQRGEDDLEPASTNPATTPSVPVDTAALPPTTSVEPADVAATAADDTALMERLIDALNSVVVDDADDLTRIREMFTEDATIRLFSHWGQSPDPEPVPLEQWVSQLRTWGFEGALWEGACVPREGGEESVSCFQRVRWATLFAEADEWWEVEFVGDRISALRVEGDGERGSATVPLAVADLVYWEQWLRENDPETAARLVPSIEFEEAPVVTRYDPAVASEIHASIQSYVENRPPGDEISVTTDVVEVGDRLVPVSMASAGGRRYVLAGRYQTAIDLERAVAQQAVLAAFDDGGRELWRTELEGCPSVIDVVDDVVWVGSGPTAGRCNASTSRPLTRVDSSDGRVLGQITVYYWSDMVGAFRSLWVREYRGGLTRVDPDLSTTTVEGPFVDLSNGCDDCPEGPTAGTDAIWVPLGNLGVAVIDPVTNQLTTIPREEIGHDVVKVAFDGEVAYVASRDQVTSIVDRQVRATVRVGHLLYLGPLDGLMGVQLLDGQFVVLGADDPMVVERRQTSGGLVATDEIDGEGWVHYWNGRKPEFRRVDLLPAPEGDG